MFLNLRYIYRLDKIWEFVLDFFNKVVRLAKLVFIYTTHTEFFNSEGHRLKFKLFSPHKTLDLYLLFYLGHKGSHVEFGLLWLDI